MENVRTIMANLPNTVKAYTIFKDDFFTIVLNENLSYEQNLLSYAHELEHIHCKDFEKYSSVGTIELIAHQIYI